MVVFLALAVAPQVADRASAPPSWYAEQLALLTANGGRWEADNAKFKSETEPFDAYVLEWAWGPGRASVRGRLFAMRGGKETPVVWEFHQFWDPATKTVRLQQHGTDGTYGDGTLELTSSATIAIDQTFWARDGRQWRERHDEEVTATRRVSRSTRLTDGTWVAGREYIWVLRKAGE
jgi:hypothetical protein